VNRKDASRQASQDTRSTTVEYVANRRSIHTRCGRSFHTTDITPTDKRRKTLAVGPSNTLRIEEAFALAEEGFSGNRCKTSRQPSLDTRTLLSNRLPIDEAFALAE
jgi:hypothetical protein